MSSFCAVVGDVQYLKKEVGEINRMKNEMQEVHTVLADIVGMLKSGTRPDPFNLAADKVALHPTVPASVSAPLDMKPELSVSKKKKKKKTVSKDALGVQYTTDQLKQVGVSLIISFNVTPLTPS